jgi:uncharacterized protein (TIGR02594 family)
MTIRRVITDIAPTDVPFILAMIAADGGTVVSQEPEPGGEITVVAEFPDRPAPVAATRAAATRRGPAAATAPAPPAAAPVPDAPWMAIARDEMGVAEVPGTGSNPRISEYHATTHGGPETDSVPWCSSFVNFCITQAGLTGTQSKMARSWMTWGRDAGAFVPGCIVVLQRGAAPRGHVGFCVEAVGGIVALLGGNQGNAVTISSFDASRVLARRLPS